MRVDGPIELKNNNLLHIGESFIVVNIMPNQFASKLKLKVFGGLSTGDVYYFDGEECANHSLKIGRMRTCEI
jgi:hypothetical protein